MKTDLPVTKWFGKKTSISNRHAPRGSKIHIQYFFKNMHASNEIFNFSDFFSRLNFNKIIKRTLLT